MSRLLPWVSLAVGIASAIIMNRGPERAVLVAAAAVGVWLVLLAAVWARGRAQARNTALWKGAHFSVLAITQWAMQLSLFFALPSYWRAWAGTPGQAVFLGVLTAAAIASLWDPLTQRLLRRPGFAPLMPALATFSALNAVLPGLGLSNTESVWAAVGCTAVALPIGLVAADLDAQQRKRFAVGTALAIVALPVGLWAGGARVVPAAPLALLEADIGTHQAGRWVADPLTRLERKPASLMCATAIWAPLGVNERLYHVWRHDGAVRDRIPLDVSGGRENGFRTWSRKRNFGDDPAGVWTCSVETQLGQLLGERAVVVDPS